MRFCLIVLCLFLFACDEEVGSLPVAPIEDKLTFDEKLIQHIDIRNWYVYSSDNRHLVLSKQDVFKMDVLGSDDEVLNVLKFQILSYYKFVNGKDRPGNFLIRVQGRDDVEERNIELSIKPCLKDPKFCKKTKSFSMLNLISGESWVSSDRNDMKKYDWHLAFGGQRGEKILYNKDAVRLEGYYRHPVLAEKSGSDVGKITFSSLFPNSQKIFNTQYFLNIFKKL